MAEIKLPDSFTSIGASAFEGCSGLKKITIPDSVISIGDSAFFECSGLTEIKISDSVKSINDYAFYGCSGLTEMKIPKRVTSIGASAFEGCGGLKKITIPNSVTSIGDNAFFDCSGLTSIKIPKSVTNIGAGAFCFSGLTKITIPAGVTTIGEDAFGECNELKEINVDSQNNNYSSTDGVLFNKDKSALLCYPMRKNAPICNIPEGVTNIGDYAFNGCSELIEITIPEGVTSIGDGAFAGCSGLTKITIPKSVTSIGKDAFCECNGLTEIIIPDNVTKIGDLDFDKPEELKNKILEIKEELDLGDETQVTIKKVEEIILKIENNAINEIRVENGRYEPKENEMKANVVDGTLILPDNIVGIDWMLSPYTRQYQMEMSSADSPDDESLVTKDMPVCQSITKIVIPSSLKYIKSGFFHNFPYLERIQFPEHSSLEDIGPRTFADCRKLQEVVIPPNKDGKEVIIGVDTFIGCTNIRKIDTPENSRLIMHAYKPFLGCDHIYSWKIRGRAHKIGYLYGQEESLEYEYKYVRNLLEELEEDDKKTKLKDETDKIIDVIAGQRFLLYQQKKDNEPSDYGDPNSTLEDLGVLGDELGSLIEVILPRNLTRIEDNLLSGMRNFEKRRNTRGSNKHWQRCIFWM